jgi:hypothetical protein
LICLLSLTYIITKFSAIWTLKKRLWSKRNKCFHLETIFCLCLFIICIRDRPFNLKGGGLLFLLFRSEFCFRTTRELEYFFFSPEFNIRLYDKNSENICFFWITVSFLRFRSQRIILFVVSIESRSGRVVPYTTLSILIFTRTIQSTVHDL